MKTACINQYAIRKEKGGAFITNYSGVLTDELDNKRAFSGSIGTSQQDTIPTQIEYNLKTKLGFSTLHVKHPIEGYLTQEQIAATPEKRGPGRPRIHPVT